MTTPLTTHDNSHYYRDGQFDAAAAKASYYEMMEYFNYPIVPRLKDEGEFWTLDFTTGLFTEIGMAGIFWVNHQEHNYLGHEIFLLPGQMIPEHRHLKVPEAQAKLESWQVRHGMVHLFSQEPPNPGDEELIPPSHRDICHAKKALKVLPGEVGSLTKAEDWHFMVAGPEGAIVTEYATYHVMDALRFSHPKVSLG